MTRFNHRRPACAAIVADMGETVRIEFDPQSARQFAGYLARELRAGAADAAALAAAPAPSAVSADMRQLARPGKDGEREAAYVDETGRNVRWVPNRIGVAPRDWRPIFVRGD